MFEVDNRLLIIYSALVNNGLLQIQESLRFSNSKCEIEVDLDKEVFEICYKDKSGDRCICTSNDLDLYFLFGFLSAHELIDRNFKL